jgi:type II secretory pathway component PulL
VTLRNFGLSFSRQDARRNAGVSWRLRRAAAGIAFLLVMILIAVLWATLAHAAEIPQTLLATADEVIE